MILDLALEESTNQTLDIFDLFVNNRNLNLQRRDIQTSGELFHEDKHNFGLIQNVNPNQNDSEGEDGYKTRASIDYNMS